MHVTMEATGNYHLLLSKLLSEDKVDYSVVNPFRIKRFADMKLRRSRNDKVDAFTIAQYGREQQPPLHRPPSKAQQEIKTLTSVIDGLIKQRTQLKNMLHALQHIPNPDKSALNSLKTVSRQLNKQIEKLEKKGQKLVKDNYSQQAKSMASVKGIGPKTTAAFIGHFADLENYDSSKQVAAAIGINPAPQQSGISKNKSSGISKQGNARLRTLFYMAALSAARHNVACKELYQRLLKKGKKKKTALIAVANKLVKQLFTVVKNETEFVNGYNRNWTKNS